MDLIVSRFQNNADNEEDDYGSFFLQPASSPYNIAEKVHQANLDLFNNTLIMEKTSRVTFKEELSTYEPQLTDDDVNSIESDPEEIETASEDHPQVLEYRSCNVINLNIFDINEEEEAPEEEYIEEIEPDEIEEVPIIVDNSVEALTGGEKSDDCNVEIFGEIDSPTIRLSSSASKPSTKRKRTRKKSPQLGPARGNFVECRNHCIEKLDFDLSMSIRKLEIQEKPANCPLLKLQSRKCCDDNKAKNLPCYNGLRSEYGLSSTALEKREKRNEIIRLKQQKRQQLLQEYKNRKNQQNEEVFCQWLKDVARRRAQRKQKIENVRGKEPLSPNVINFPTKVGEKAKERPKTANEFVPRQQAKRARRPHTSPAACVFIEVPHKLLERGIRIGDLLVGSSHFAAKKMHILAVSS